MAKYYCPVHYDAADLRDLYRGGEDGGVDSAAAVVGTSGDRFHGNSGNGGGSSGSDGYGGGGGGGGPDKAG